MPYEGWRSDVGIWASSRAESREMPYSSVPVERLHGSVDGSEGSRAEVDRLIDLIDLTYRAKE